MDVLSDEALQAKLSTLHVAWSALPGEGLVRIFDVSSFAEGMQLLQKISTQLSDFDYSPEARLTSTQLALTIAQPEAGGMTEKDIAMAQAIDQLIE